MPNLDMARYLKVLWKWAWLIVACGVLGAGVSYMATRSMPKVFRSSAIVLVGEDTMNAKVNQEDQAISARLALTYAALARRQPVLEATLKNLHLRYDWRTLQANVLVVRPDLSNLMEIRVTDNDANTAAAIANEVARQLVLESPTDENTQDLNKRRDFIQRQLDAMQTQIKGGEEFLRIKTAAIDSEQSARAILNLRDEIQTEELKLAGWRQTYAQLLAQKPVRLPNTLSLIEPAVPAILPLSPNMTANVALGGLAGVLLSSLAVLVIAYFFSNRIISLADVGQLVGLTPLGPITDMGRLRTLKDALVALKAPDSPIAEGFRRVRTNVQFGVGNSEPINILVTSPGLHEGKSTISANLAVSFAQAGKRTLLIDADIRHPSLHLIFGIANRGLTDVFWGEPSETPAKQHAPFEHDMVDQLTRRIRAFTTPAEVPGLRLLPVGELPVGSPAELLGSSEMQQLLMAVRREFDVIVIDSPPVLPVADTAILAAMGLSVLLVVEAGRTSGQALRQANEILDRAQAQILGVVLNKAPRSPTPYYDFGNKPPSQRRRPSIRVIQNG